jgi:hypothetical protein
MQYQSKQGLYAVGRLVEKAVADAEASGARVLTLGLLNQVHPPMSIVLLQPLQFLFLALCLD